MTLTEPARDAARILLDVLSALDESAASPQAMETAFERLNEVGAVKVQVDGGNKVDADLTGLVAGAVFTIRQLIQELTDRTGKSDIEVIVALREWLRDA